jgi:quercetin dioxygenase-like cupin family protein
MGFLQNRIQRGGAEARRVFVRVGAVLFLFCMLAGVQNLKPEQKTKSTAADAAPKIVPITEEQHHHLVLDNDYVRVFHVEVAPHSETLYHQHDMDYVFVTLGDSEVESVPVGKEAKKLELKDGDTRFTKGGFAHKAVNLSDKPFVNVTVELKKYFDAEMKVCADQLAANCSRDVKVGDEKIGETTKIFTNGFVTAMGHHLMPHGTLTSNYYSARGKDGVLIVPLTDMKAVVGGVEEDLKAGQSNFTDAGEVEIPSQDHDVRWVVIRMNVPK